MKPRETLPTAESLDRLEAPSREVAAAQRKALAAEISDKPAFREALDAVNRSHGEGQAEALPLELSSEVSAETEIAEQDEPRQPGARRTAKLPDEVSERRTGLSVRKVLDEQNLLAEDSHESAPREPRRTGLLFGVLLLAALLVGALLFAMGAFSGAETVPTGAPADTGLPSATATATAQPAATPGPTTSSPVAPLSGEPAMTSSSTGSVRDPATTSSVRPSAHSATTTASSDNPPPVPPTHTATVSSPPPTATTSSTTIPWIKPNN